MMRDHTLIEELLSVQALEGLDGGDVALLESRRNEHGDCAECRKLEDEFNEIAGRLGFALDPEPIDPRMADEILLRAGSPNVAIQPEHLESADVARERLSTRRGRWDRNWTAVAAAAAVLMVFGTIAVIRSGGTTPIGTITSAQQIVRFTGNQGAADVVMAYTPGKAGVVLVGTGLPNPGPGKVYELWMIRGQTPLSGGCVAPADGGIAAALPASPVGGDLMAVTVESTSCPPAPTTTPILTVQLS